MVHVSSDVVLGYNECINTFSQGKYELSELKEEFSMTEEEISALKREFMLQANMYLEAVFTNVIVPKLSAQSQPSDLDIVTSFLDDHCRFSPDLDISSRDLYQAYVQLNPQESTMSHRKFSQYIQTIGETKGIRWKKKSKTSYWAGISLHEEAVNHE